MKPLKKLLRADGGAQVLEYALLVSVVTLLVLIGLRPLAPSLCDLQQRVGQLLALNAAQACADGGSGGNNGGGGTGGGGTGGGGGGGVGGGGSGGGGGGPGGGSGGGSGGGTGGGGGGGSGAGRP